MKLLSDIYWRILDRLFDFGPCGTGAKMCYDCPHFFENCSPSRKVAETGRIVAL